MGDGIGSESLKSDNSWKWYHRYNVIDQSGYGLYVYIYYKLSATLLDRKNKHI